jgi:hypothetical protein
MKTIVVLSLLAPVAAALVNITQLEQAFVANYEPGQFIEQNANDADVALNNANAAYLPQITLRQQFQSQNFQTTGLQLAVGATWNAASRTSGRKSPCWNARRTARKRSTRCVRTCRP